MDTIKDFLAQVFAYVAWFFSICFVGIYLLGVYAIITSVIVGAVLIPFLPLVMGIWLISLLF